MNKRLYSLLFVSLISIHSMSAESTKQDNLETLFSLMNNKDQSCNAMMPLLAPIFEQYSFKDEKTKNEAKTKSFDAWWLEIKKEFITSYDKHFDASEIQELIKFYSSSIGKKFSEKGAALGLEMNKAGARLLPIIQETVAAVSPQPVQESNKTQEHASKWVTNLEDLTKKSETSAEEVFEQAIKHEGLTVIKFSATWCGPCKKYISTFNDVAEHNQEITVDGKTISVKYLAIDIDTFPKIAQMCKATSVPTTLFYKHGKQAASLIGARDKETIVNKLQEVAKN